jgi:serine/threonine protein kinase
MMQGTMTHMAPEILMYGKISSSSDVYAFGILLWELYTGSLAFKGVPKALLGHEITQKHLRPTLPEDCPQDYAALTQRCWADEPADRCVPGAGSWGGLWV